MNDHNEPIDEWIRVGELLGDHAGVIQAKTRLGRVLRRAVVLASDPDVDEETLDVIRRLTGALNRAADHLSDK